MNTSSPRRPRRPVDRSRARTAALINQCATPGLGSLMAGRWVVGIGQLLLAVAGFVMFISWFMLLLLQLYREWVDGAEPKPVGWLGAVGAVTFAAAWLWALVTSLSLLREARAGDQPAD